MDSLLDSFSHFSLAEGLSVEINLSDQIFCYPVLKIDRKLSERLSLKGGQLVEVCFKSKRTFVILDTNNNEPHFCMGNFSLCQNLGITENSVLRVTLNKLSSKIKFVDKITCSDYLEKSDLPLVLYTGWKFHINSKIVLVEFPKNEVIFLSRRTTIEINSNKPCLIKSITIGDSSLPENATFYESSTKDDVKFKNLIRRNKKDPKILISNHSKSLILKETNGKKDSLGSPATYDFLFEEIGGYSEAKNVLLDAIHSILDNKLSNSYRGILLFGPPGCSKTLLVKSISRNLGLNFFSIKGPEIYSKWIGESEKSIKEIFSKAKSKTPSIVFIDEIDAISKKRCENQSVETRVLSQLLIEIDGIYNFEEKVLVIGTTNRPDLVDEALLRSGRLDIHLFISLPDIDSIIQIISIQVRNYKISGILDVAAIAKRFLGFSGAEIVSSFQKAAYLALSKERNYIEHDDIVAVLLSSIPETDQRLLKYYEAFSGNRSW